MSNIEQIKEISTNLSEPEWMKEWRGKRLEEAGVLPQAVKHGIGITAVFPEMTPDYSGEVTYHVDATRGLEIYTWREAMTQEEIEPIVRGLLESNFFPIAKDHFRALGQALFRSGLVVYVQPRVSDSGELQTEKLILDTLLSEKSSADIVLVVLKEGARCEFSSHASGARDGVVHARTFVVLSEQESQLRVTQTSALSPGAMMLLFSRAIVAGHSVMRWRELISGETLISTVTESLLIGEGATGEVLQGVSGEGRAEIDVDVSSRHVASGTHSSIKTAGTAFGRSRILYRGLVDMSPGVAETHGTQEARFLVCDPSARVDAIPALDVASSAVSSSHKLSVSHIKSGDTFYPKLRGLSDVESRALFLEGHFGQVFGGDENADMMNTLLAQFALNKHDSTR